MDKQQQLVVERALKHLSHPVLASSKPAQRLERLLAGAKESGDLPTDDLRRATVELVRDVDIPKYFATGGAGDEPINNGLAFLFLLILLTILLALADEGSDLASLIEQLIKDLIDSLSP